MQPGDYRFVVEMDLVIDMADEFERIFDTYDGPNCEKVCDVIEAVMDAPPERFDHVLLNVDGDTAYFIAIPPRKWRDGLAMVRKLVKA